MPKKTSSSLKYKNKQQRQETGCTWQFLGLEGSIGDGGLGDGGRRVGGDGSHGDAHGAHVPHSTQCQEVRVQNGLRHLHQAIPPNVTSLHAYLSHYSNSLPVWMVLSSYWHLCLTHESMCEPVMGDHPMNNHGQPVSKILLLSSSTPTPYLHHSPLPLPSPWSHACMHKCQYFKFSQYV